MHHPLDIDLIDYVNGFIGREKYASEIEAHLKDCSLCQSKVQRIKDAES